MIALEEYLAAEGHKNSSTTDYDTFRSMLPRALAEEYDQLCMVFERDNIPAHIRQFYNHAWDTGISVMLENGLWERTTVNAPIISALIKKSTRVLDMGCGEGLKTTYYAINHPDTEFYANDLRIEAVARAQKRAKKYGARNTKFLAADNTVLPFKEAFDLIISDHTLHETALGWNGDPGFEFKIETLSQALKPGGSTIILLTPQYEPEILQGHLQWIAEANGLIPEFMRRSYTKYGHTEEDLILIARKQQEQQ